MQLAHPLYGIMMLDFRPVDCTSHQPLALLPGYISNTVYGDRVETGWAWFPYQQSAAQFWEGVRRLSGAIQRSSCRPCGSCPATCWGPAGGF